MSDRSMTNKVELTRKFATHEVDEFLEQRLPFSVNMLTCFRKYRDRSEFALLKHSGSLVAAMCVFKTGYNNHIWHDPTIWITGDAESSTHLASVLEIDKAVIMSDFDLTGFVKDNRPDAHAIEEKIMVNPDLTSFRDRSTDAILLGPDYATQSLELAGFSHEADNLGALVEREARFLSERTSYGVFDGGKLVSRGAIMSSNNSYSSVGAFFTRQEHRRKGYATEVINAVLNEASELSENACLFVNGANSTAISLYQKIGFRVVQNAYFTDLNTGLVP